MGMSAGGSNSGLNNEPNVVPMIDIMLVLLIIFMIMQPMMRKAIDLQLPDPEPAVVTANNANRMRMISTSMKQSRSAQSPPWRSRSSNCSVAARPSISASFSRCTCSLLIASRRFGPNAGIRCHFRSIRRS